MGAARPRTTRRLRVGMASRCLIVASPFRGSRVYLNQAPGRDVRSPLRTPLSCDRPRQPPQSSHARPTHPRRRRCLPALRRGAGRRRRRGHPALLPPTPGGRVEGRRQPGHRRRSGGGVGHARANRRPSAAGRHRGRGVRLGAVGRRVRVGAGPDRRHQGLHLGAAHLRHADRAAAPRRARAGRHRSARQRRALAGRARPRRRPASGPRRDARADSHPRLRVAGRRVTVLHRPRAVRRGRTATPTPGSWRRCA